jgi:transcriptional regulator with PAS, ATPase and Fis domain
MITRHRPLLDILDNVAKAARSDSTILVLGESGVGKELVANGIHRLSGRKGPMIPINCAAIPRDMIESELFGHTAGSFTGAVRDRAGLFEICDEGTVFLDEVGEMSHDLQTKMLRFLETHETRRLGGHRSVRVNTRVVAATNRDGGAMERGDGFRQDLFYRLSHVVVTIPALRHRREDIEPLIDHFLEDACAREGPRIVLSAAARQRMLEYAWPGNVRQLRMVIRRVVVLGTPGVEVGPEALGLTESRVAVTLEEELEAQEKRRIEEALAASRGSRADAARALGIPRTTLLNRMKRFGLT